MRNQTKVALMAGILTFILGMAWYASEWDYYSHRKVLITPAEYEIIERTPMERVGSITMAVMVYIIFGSAIFVVVAPTGILRDN